MKSRSLFTASRVFVLTLLAMMVALAGQAQQFNLPHYTVTDLGTLGGGFSLAYGINNKGQVAGFSTLSGNTAGHSFVFENGLMTDLGTLGGPNSQSFANLNQATQVAGSAETTTSDPNGEDFCGFGTHLICLGFVWQNGTMTPLDTLGGNNGQAAAINERGRLAGYAENAIPDKNCPPPQVLHFRSVVWDQGGVHSLPLYKGDSDGAAFWINNRGDVVGASGSCAAYNPDLGLPLQATHALLWTHGWVFDLGNLGGKINNSALAINDLGDVIGASDLPGDTYQHAFLWREGRMHDLGTLKGDVISAALGINDSGQVTGVSIDASGNLRAFLWQNGTMSDLNSLVSADSPLYLLHGFGINSAGQIVGFGADSSGDVHAFLATPCDRNHGDEECCGDTEGIGTQANEAAKRPRVALSESARKLLQQHLGFGRFETGLGRDDRVRR
jgi:probable HAF family extracellular repeat protein